MEGSEPHALSEEKSRAPGEQTNPETWTLEGRKARSCVPKGAGEINQYGDDLQ